MKQHRGAGSIYLRGAVWWIQYWRHGKCYRESSHCHKESVARGLLKRRQGEIALGRFIGPEADKVTVRELAADYLTDYQVNDKASLDKAERLLKRHDNDGKEIDSEFMRFFGDFRAHNVTTDQVKRYIAQRKEKGAANGTVNRELSGLKRMFNLGIQAEKIYRKPYIPMLQEGSPRAGFFEHGEFIALRDASPDYFKPVVTFAYFTGWRKEEILSLRWNQVDLSARIVRLDPGTTKNKDGRQVMLEEELLEVMQEQWERRKVAEIPGESPTLLCPYVFHRNGKPTGDIRDVWQSACVAAGLGQMIEIEQAGKKKQKYVGKLFHDFRRTAVRNMIRNGTPERVAMQISGHKTRSVFDRYNITSEDDLREAARRMSLYTRNLEQTSNVVKFKQN